MRQLAGFVFLAFSAGLPALALDVSGKVYDKLVNPVPGAKACVKGDPNTCATTDAEGAFHLAQTVALRPQRTDESGFSLTYRGGSLIVRSPAAVVARLEWLSADGRRRWAAAEADLAPGANALPLPFGLPRAGLVLLRLSTPGQVLTCKAFLASGATIAGKVSSGAPAIAALSKAAASALEISKAGYRTRTYLPAAETEINVSIVLSDTADADTATAGGMEGPFVNDFGASTNLSLHGQMTTSNEFFKPFGNGRACVSCHRPQDGFTITPKSLQALFHACGLDTDDPSQRPSQADPTACAVFRTNDGSLSAASDVSTAAARRKAYSLLLSRGLIHLTFPLPAGAQFDVVAVNDPYGVATNSTLSVYRRPLPATNLPFLASVMWDMRETAPGFLGAPFTPDISHAGPLNDQLKKQAMDATHDHAAAMAPGLTDAQAQSIVDFETSIYSAQTHLAGGGDLSGDGILGPAALAKQSVTPVCGNLDQYDNNPAYPQCRQYTYDPLVFTMFDRWAKAMGTDAQSALKASIARGQALFNTRKAPSPTQRDASFYEHQNDNVNTTCSTCHTSFNTGGSTVPVGFANVVVGVGPSTLNAPTPPADFLDKQLPIYTLRCNSRGAAAYRASGGLSGCQHDGSEPGIPAEEIQVNDPGRGLITGTWPSTAAFKAPTLRNLAARPPYFHDGSAATLADVVEHYKQAMGFQFTDSEKQDLINFLKAL